MICVVTVWSYRNINPASQDKDRPHATFLIIAKCLVHFLKLICLVPVYWYKNFFQLQAQGVFLISKFCQVVNFGLFLLGDSLASKFCVLTFWNTVCSIIKGHGNKKNNWNEIASVFIQVKVWLKRSLGQSEGGGTGRGRVRVEGQAVEGNSPVSEWGRGALGWQWSN
jgi:hypothetical protein